MSIKRELKQLVDQEVLWCVEPFPGDPATRAVLLSSSLNSIFHRAAKESRIARLQADLQNIVAGGEVTLSFTPFKHLSATFGVLEPAGEGTWEIRSRHPSPGLRVFGRFAEVDTFVAIDWAPRSKPLEGFDKKPLLGRKSLEYQFAQIEVDQFWNKHLAKQSPIYGERCSDYFTDKCSAGGAEQ
jgi:hypothetical protein